MYIVTSINIHTTRQNAHPSHYPDNAFQLDSKNAASLFSPGSLNLCRHPPLSSHEQLHPVNNATSASGTATGTRKSPGGSANSCCTSTHIDPSVVGYLKAHDIHRDELHLEDSEAEEEWRRRIGWVFEHGLPDEQRFEMRWVSKEVGSLGFDAQYRSNFLRFVNMPQGQHVGGVACVAVRQIEAGEEVTIEYGIDYWEHRPGVLLQEASGRLGRTAFMENPGLVSGASAQGGAYGTCSGSQHER
ncbi:hypothetical protein DFJ73DRAFT_761488 [Zopfochytrium polystomum]|nr:hypothetical protein DFJ73DRAFT_761488 [Zopfochytrium polystomum]